MIVSKEKPIALSKQQLAVAYNVTLKTFNKWVEPLEDEIGEYRGKVYTPKQVLLIFEFLGSP